MNRTEMINALKAAGLRATPTVATEDMGLQYDYSTPEGAGTSFGGMGSWPALAFGPINPEQWKKIIEEVQSGSLTVETLAETGLDEMFGSIYTLDKLDPADVLKNILLVASQSGVFYCLFDTGMYYAEKPEFFASLEELEKAFIDNYCRDIISWDEMDDSEIENWYSRLSDDLSEFAIYHYSCYEQD